VEIANVVAILRCASCGADASLIRQDDRLNCKHCGRVFHLDGKTVRMSSAHPTTSEWQRKQSEAVCRYSDEEYNADKTLYELFAGFVALTLPSTPVVLDVGCGIAQDLPVYARNLRASYIGLEPLDVSVDRSYYCISGAVAESIPLADHTVDAFLFATSLDHVQDVGKALAEIRRVLRKGGRVYLWVGLRDPDLLFGAHNLYGTFFHGSLIKRAARVLLSQAVLAKFAVAVALTQLRMQRGVPLDDFHFHYYTRASLREELTNGGLAIARQIVVPGSLSIFIDCTVSDSKG
jgi:ubiquinone/menaquinone biosynthesis C-methylase UbiE